MPIRQALVMTTHAIQGKEFNKYIIAETKPSLLYTQLSRGRNGLDSIQLLPEITTAMTRKAKPSEEMNKFFAHNEELATQTASRHLFLS